MRGHGSSEEIGGKRIGGHVGANEATCVRSARSLASHPATPDSVTAVTTESRAFADDLEVGRHHEFETFTISEGDLVDFASQWDPQSFHVDADAAESGAFGGLIASGIHTLAVFQRLAVRAVFDHWQVIAGRRLVDVAFLRPVRPDDTLTGSMTIDAVTFDKPGRALVTCAGRLLNGDDREVLLTMMEVFVRARD